MYNPNSFFVVAVLQDKVLEMFMLMNFSPEYVSIKITTLSISFSKTT